MPEQLRSTTDCAEELGVNVNVIHHLLRTGQVEQPEYRKGPRYFWTMQEFVLLKRSVEKRPGRGRPKKGAK